MSLLLLLQNHGRMTALTTAEAQTLFLSGLPGQATAASRIEVDVTVDDDQGKACRVAQHGAKRRQLTQVELGWPVRRGLGNERHPAS
jgi:hypothetical protein